ncbi:MAG: NUDIX hydrolase [Nitrospinaceae bacterium]
MNLFLISTKLKNQFPVVREELETHPQKAAVLVILFIRNHKACVLMTKRAMHLQTHAGQISFPGGMPEPGDEDLLSTAIRETREEVGVIMTPRSVIGRLDGVRTRNGIDITPFVSILDSPLDEIFCNDEVHEALQIPLAPLLATQQPDVGFKPSEGMVVYWYKHHRIWGASAKILQQIENLGVL